MDWSRLRHRRDAGTAVAYSLFLYIKRFVRTCHIRRISTRPTGPRSGELGHGLRILSAVVSKGADFKD